MHDVFELKLNMFALHWMITDMNWLEEQLDILGKNTYLISYQVLVIWAKVKQIRCSVNDWAVVVPVGMFVDYGQSQANSFPLFPVLVLS